MSRKLHKFQTVAEYMTYSASTDYTTPCVAVVEENNVIYYDYGNNKPQADMSDFKVESEESSVGGEYFGKNAITKANYIPSGITNLSSGFNGLSGLITAPEIPSSVTSMNYTFQFCISLVNVPPIPNSVINLDNTFWSCTSLKEVTFLHTTPPSYRGTFLECSSLESIYVPDSAVDAFKTATGWSEFADKFKPLSSKPSE